MTPRGKPSVPGFAASTHTPSPPLPMSKRILTADQKLSKSLQSAGLDADHIARIKAELEAKTAAKEAAKEQKEREKVEKALKKKKKDAEAQRAAMREDLRITMELRQRLAAQCPDIGHPGGPEVVRLFGADQGDGAGVPASEPSEPVAKPKRKRHGPMTDAMELFIAARKADGLNYMQAMGLWRDSDERAAIVNRMTPAERKKRRYDLPPAAPVQPAVPAEPADGHLE